MNYSPETPKAKDTANNNFGHFIDNVAEKSETIVYNIEPDSQSSSPIKIVASSSANIFSDATALPPQELQHITSDDEQQSACPISIFLSPAKKALDAKDAVEQV